MVVSRRGGRASSHHCNICLCNPNFYGVTVSPGTAVFLVGNGYQFAGYGSYLSCNYGEFEWDLTSCAGWQADNAPVATVSRGCTTGANGGSAHISASYYDCT
jgi:hypothetical protein